MRCELAAMRSPRRLRVRVKVLRLYTDREGRLTAVVRYLASGDVLHVWADTLEAVPS